MLRQAQHERILNEVLDENHTNYNLWRKTMPFAANPFDALKNMAKYLREFRGKTFVIKLGGEVLDDLEARKAVAEQISVLWTLSIRVVIVHGGGSGIDDLCSKLNLPIEKIQGRRVTSGPVLDAVKMVLAGSVHTDLLAEMNSAGIPSVGLSGIDAGMIRAHQRPPLYVGQHLEGPLKGQAKLIDYGHVADIDSVDPKLIQTLLDQDYVPVICPITADQEGQVLNTNADTIAAAVASALHAEKLFFVLKVQGLLKDMNVPNSVISFASLTELDEMVARGEVSGGMLPKTTAIRNALNHDVHSVHMVSGMLPDALLVEVFTNEGAGTKLVKEHSNG
jgi:acetylglutamate kinase